MTYQTSKDHERLYALITAGAVIVCWVRTGELKVQAIALCRMDERYFVGSPGIGYNRPYFADRANCDRKTFFIRDCERMNLEFIDPGTQLTSEEIAAIMPAIDLTIATGKGNIVEICKRVKEKLNASKTELD